ncbi:UNVERIFIED_CONTAM: hypothetical protein FKN15_075048 [Acipenser sinensis]
MGTARREIYTFSPGFSRISKSSPDSAGTVTLSKIFTCGGSTRALALGFSAHRSSSPTCHGLAFVAPMASDGWVWAQRYSTIHFQGLLRIWICTCGGSTRALALGFSAHRSGPPTRRGLAFAAPVASDGRVWARRYSAIHFQG